MSLYNLHIKPLVYASAILLPIAYIVGMIFSLKTHAAQINADYMRSLEEANHEGRNEKSQNRNTLNIIEKYAILSVGTLCFLCPRDQVTCKIR